MDLCLRNRRCYSANFRQVREGFHSVLRCDMNTDSRRERPADLMQQLGSTYLENNSGQLRKVEFAVT